MNPKKTLLQILIEELPKRGGWPLVSAGCRQFPDGEIVFNNVDGSPDFYAELASDVDQSWEMTKTPHITREQYALAVHAQQKICPTLGAECRGCPDCPGGSSTGLTSGDITNEAAHEELEADDLNECIGQQSV
jgi:hypothetical protein